MGSSLTTTTQLLSMEPKRKIYVFYDASGEKREYLYEPNQRLATLICRDNQLDHSSLRTKYFNTDGGKSMDRHTASHLLNAGKLRVGKPHESPLVKRTHRSGLERSTKIDQIDQRYRERSQLSSIVIQTRRTTHQLLISRNRDSRNQSAIGENRYHWVNHSQKLLPIANQWLGYMLDFLLLLITAFFRTRALQGAIAATRATKSWPNSLFNILLWLSLCMPCVVPFDPRERQSIELKSAVVDL